MDYGASDLPGGGKRLEFTDAADSAGYKKAYIQEIDAQGNVVRHWSEVVGPGNKLGKVVWYQGGPK